MNGTDDEFHLMKRSLYPVIGKRASLTTTVSSKSRNLAVYMQICSVALRQLMRMRSKCKLQSTPWQCRSRHTAACVIGNNLQSCSLSIRQCAPADILTVAHTLRLGEVHELLFHLACIESDERACLAVGIVVERSTSVISIVVELFRQFHHISQPRKDNRRVATDDAACHTYVSVGIYGISLCSQEVEIIFLHLVASNYFLKRLTCLSRAMACASLGWSLTAHGIYNAHATIRVVDNNRPCHSIMTQVVESILEPLAPCPVVVVYRSTEGIYPRSTSWLYDILASIYKLADTSVGIVEAQAEGIACDGNGIRAVVYNKRRMSLAGRLSHIILSRRTFQLFAHLHISLPCPRHILAKTQLNVEEILTITGQVHDIERQTVQFRGARSMNAAVGDKLPATLLTTILYKYPSNEIVT